MAKCQRRVPLKSILFVLLSPLCLVRFFSVDTYIVATYGKPKGNEAKRIENAVVETKAILKKSARGVADSSEAMTISSEKDSDSTNESVREILSHTTSSEECRARFQESPGFKQTFGSWIADRVPLLLNIYEYNGRSMASLRMDYQIPSARQRMYMVANWTCNDGRPARRIRTKQAMFNIFVLCPDKRMTSLTLQYNKTTPQNHVYNTSAYQQCEDLQHQSQMYAGGKHLAACTSVRGQSNKKNLPEWIAHHRLLGVEKFWIYLNEPWNLTGLPKSENVTYIPYNYCLCDYPEIMRFSQAMWTAYPFFQTNVLGECLYRAKENQVEWLLLNDVDELVFFPEQTPTNRSGGAPLIKTIPQYLETIENVTDIPTIYMKSVPFGRNVRVRENITLMADYVWRKNANFSSYSSARQKVLANTKLVETISVHGPMATSENARRRSLNGPIDKIRIHHFKKPQQGVFQSRGQVIRAPELRDQFSEILHKKLAEFEYYD